MANGNIDECPIWGGGSVLPRLGDYFEIESRRAGGRYRISGTALAILSHKKTPQLNAKLTTWIINQHRNGEPSPMITSEVMREVEGRRRLKPSEQIVRFFLLADSRQFTPGSVFKIGGSVDETYIKDTADLCAWLEIESGQISGFIQLLEDLDYVKLQIALVRLTAKGFQRLEDVQSSPSGSLQAFVAMWFDPSMSEAFEYGVEKAITAAGYQPMRIDRKEHNNKIDDEIVAEIRRSRFVVADFTCGTLPYDGKTVALARGGVYFEAGFAMGLGIPVIWCCREDLIDNVHFDTRQFAHVTWTNPNDLMERLYRRIAAVIGEQPDAQGLRHDGAIA